jgi:hypothetical protein
MRWRGLDWRCGCDADRSATACCAARHAGRPPALSSGFPVLLTLRGRPRPVPVFSGESCSTPASGGCTRAFPQLFRDSLFIHRTGGVIPRLLPLVHRTIHNETHSRRPGFRGCGVSQAHMASMRQPWPGRHDQTRRLPVMRLSPFPARAGRVVDGPLTPIEGGRWPIDPRPPRLRGPANVALHGQNGPGGRVTRRTLTLLRNACI